MNLTNYREETNKDSKEEKANHVTFKNINNSKRNNQCGYKLIRRHNSNGKLITNSSEIPNLSTDNQSLSLKTNYYKGNTLDKLADNNNFSLKSTLSNQSNANMFTTYGYNNILKNNANSNLISSNFSMNNNANSNINTNNTHTANSLIKLHKLKLVNNNIKIKSIHEIPTNNKDTKEGNSNTITINNSPHINPITDSRYNNPALLNKTNSNAPQTTSNSGTNNSKSTNLSNNAIMMSIISNTKPTLNTKCIPNNNISINININNNTSHNIFKSESYISSKENRDNNSLSKNKTLEKPVLSIVSNLKSCGFNNISTLSKTSLVEKLPLSFSNFTANQLQNIISTNNSKDRSSNNSQINTPVNFSFLKLVKVKEKAGSINNSNLMRKDSLIKSIKYKNSDGKLNAIAEEDFETKNYSKEQTCFSVGKKIQYKRVKTLNINKDNKDSIASSLNICKTSIVKSNKLTDKSSSPKESPKKLKYNLSLNKDSLLDKDKKANDYDNEVKKSLREVKFNNIVSIEDPIKKSFSGNSKNNVINVIKHNREIPDVNKDIIKDISPSMVDFNIKFDLENNAKSFKTDNVRKLSSQIDINEDNNKIEIKKQYISHNLVSNTNNKANLDIINNNINNINVKNSYNKEATESNAILNKHNDAMLNFNNFKDNLNIKENFLKANLIDYEHDDEENKETVNKKEQEEVKVYVKNDKISDKREIKEKIDFKETQVSNTAGTPLIIKNDSNNNKLNSKNNHSAQSKEKEEDKTIYPNSSESNLVSLSQKKVNKFFQQYINNKNCRLSFASGLENTSIIVNKEPASQNNLLSSYDIKSSDRLFCFSNSTNKEGDNGLEISTFNSSTPTFNTDNEEIAKNYSKNQINPESKPSLSKRDIPYKTKKQRNQDISPRKLKLKYSLQPDRTNIGSQFINYIDEQNLLSDLRREITPEKMDLVLNTQKKYKKPPLARSNKRTKTQKEELEMFKMRCINVNTLINSNTVTKRNPTQKFYLDKNANKDNENINDQIIEEIETDKKNLYNDVNSNSSLFVFNKINSAASENEVFNDSNLYLGISKISHVTNQTSNCNNSLLPNFGVLANNTDKQNLSSGNNNSKEEKNNELDNLEKSNTLKPEQIKIKNLDLNNNMSKLNKETKDSENKLTLSRNLNNKGDRILLTEENFRKISLTNLLEDSHDQKKKSNNKTLKYEKLNTINTNIESKCSFSNINNLINKEKEKERNSAKNCNVYYHSNTNTNTKYDIYGTKNSNMEINKQFSNFERRCSLKNSEKQFHLPLLSSNTRFNINLDEIHHSSSKLLESSDRKTAIDNLLSDVQKSRNTPLDSSKSNKFNSDIKKQENTFRKSSINKLGLSKQNTLSDNKDPNIFSTLTMMQSNTINKNITFITPIVNTKINSKIKAIPKQGN